MAIQNDLDLWSHTAFVAPRKIHRERDRDDPGFSDTSEFIIHLWGTSGALREKVFRGIIDGSKPEFFNLPYYNVDTDLIKTAPPYLKLSPADS